MGTMKEIAEKPSRFKKIYHCMPLFLNNLFCSHIISQTNTGIHHHKQTTYTNTSKALSMWVISTIKGYRVIIILYIKNKYKIIIYIIYIIIIILHT